MTTCALAGLIGVSAAAGAQQLADGLPADSQLRAQLARQDEQMRQAGWQVMQLIDAGRATLIWDDGSQVMKALVARNEFSTQITSARARLGAVVARSRLEVTRSHSDGQNDVPAGFYINVISTTRFANQTEPVQELVTFRLDEDRAWRVTGYSAQ